MTEVLKYSHVLGRPRKAKSRYGRWGGPMALIVACGDRCSAEIGVEGFEVYLFS